MQLNRGLILRIREFRTQNRKFPEMNRRQPVATENFACGEIPDDFLRLRVVGSWAENRLSGTFGVLIVDRLRARFRWSKSVHYSHTCLMGSWLRSVLT